MNWGKSRHRCRDTGWLNLDRDTDYQSDEDDIRRVHRSATGSS
ncbi:MAG: hypothetical protein ACLUTA_14580 [Blautia wexlerae]